MDCEVNTAIYWSRDENEEVVNDIHSYTHTHAQPDTSIDITIFLSFVR